MALLNTIAALAGGVRAPHDDQPTSSGPADANGDALKPKPKSLNDKFPPIASPEVAPVTPDLSTAHVIPAAAPPFASHKKSLSEKRAALKRTKGDRRGEKTRPLLRKLGNDYSRTLAEATWDVTMIDSRNYTDDGCYVVTEEVEDYIISAGRHKVLFEAEIRLAIGVDGHVFAAFAKLDGSDASSAYADAVEASVDDWIWVVWDDSMYTWGVAPESIDAPVWPKDRTPQELYESMLAGRLITTPQHHLVERIVLGRR